MKTAKGLKRGLCIMLPAMGMLLLLLRLPGITVNAVLSGSMEPAVRTGGIVFIDKKKRNPEIGDIITYRLGDVSVTHRVIKKEKGFYITKGDANEGEDAGPVEPCQVVGTVVCTLPFLGYWSVFLHTKAGILLLIAGALYSFLHGRISRKTQEIKRISEQETLDRAVRAENEYEQLLKAYQKGVHMGNVRRKIWKKDGKK